MPLFAVVNSTNKHENPNLYITVINQRDSVRIALLNRLNSCWNSIFVPSVKAPETTNQNDQCVLPILESLSALPKAQKKT